MLDPTPGLPKTKTGDKVQKVQRKPEDEI